jgi:hypothetical protein
MLAPKKSTYSDLKNEMVPIVFDPAIVTKVQELRFRLSQFTLGELQNLAMSAPARTGSPENSTSIYLLNQLIQKAIFLKSSSNEKIEEPIGDVPKEDVSKQSMERKGAVRLEKAAFNKALMGLHEMNQIAAGQEIDPDLMGETIERLKEKLAEAKERVEIESKNFTVAYCSDVGTFSALEKKQEAMKEKERIVQALRAKGVDLPKQEGLEMIENAIGQLYVLNNGKDQVSDRKPS